jgi:hypothetical protein
MMMVVNAPTIPAVPRKMRACDHIRYRVRVIGLAESGSRLQHWRGITCRGAYHDDDF